MKVLTTESELMKCRRDFKAAVRRHFERRTSIKIRFPGGDDLKAVPTVRKVVGDSELAIAIPRRAWNDREPYLLKINPSQLHVAPDVELNLPLRHTRRLQTCFVAGGSSIYLCHRGKFTVFQKSLPMSSGLRRFKNDRVHAIEGKGLVELIKVTSLKSTRFGEDLLIFARAVNKLKAKFRPRLTGGKTGGRRHPHVEAVDPDPGLFARLSKMSKGQRVQELDRLKAELRNLKQGKKVTRTRASRRAQRKFANAVLSENFLHRGALATRCPGCGHRRTNANGDPIMQAHHLIGFKTTKSMDPRWGAPLCPNCHVVIERANDKSRRLVGRSLLRNSPYVLGNLRELITESAIRPGWAEQLKSLGILT